MKNDGAWPPRDVLAVAEVLRDFPGKWAVAGGWAIDLALGRATRPHADVDVAVFRSDQGALRAVLRDWDLAVAAQGELTPWAPDAWLALPLHALHVRPPSGLAGRPSFEVLLNERDGDTWVYRRDPGVRLPLADAMWALPNGLRVLAPAVVLLFKSTAPRPSDEADWIAAQPLLDVESRAWLRAAIARAQPAHPWVAALAPGA